MLLLKLDCELLEFTSSSLVVVHSKFEFTFLLVWYPYYCRILHDSYRLLLQCVDDDDTSSRPILLVLSFNMVDFVRCYQPCYKGFVVLM